MKKTTSKKSSTLGTRPMVAKKSSLSGAEVCSIIEASAKAGLTELSFGELQIRFAISSGQREKSEWGSMQFTAPMDQAEFQARMQHDPSLTPSPYAQVTETQHTKMTADEIEAEELRIRAEQLAELQITDPLKYEELLLQGDLNEPNHDDHGDEDAG